MNQLSTSVAPWYHTHECDECRQHNTVLSAAVLKLIAQGAGVRSHYFAGRYENIYLAESQLPLLAIILRHARQQAAMILQRPVAQLRIGHWFNLMQQGDVTLPHTHDDDDELLSGSYYLQVPAPAGELILTAGNERKVIAPRTGLFVFFSPQLQHEVTRHPQTIPRLSIGFNVGLLPTADHDEP